MSKRIVTNVKSVLNDEKRIELSKKAIDYWVDNLSTIEESANYVGISHSTLITWIKKYKELTEYYESKADERRQVYKDKLRTTASHSLLKRVQGSEYEIAEVEGVYGLDESGNRVFFPKKAKKKKVVVQPSDTAIIFALTNVDPENFKNRHQVDGEMEVKTFDWSKIPLEERKRLLKYFDESDAE